MVNQNDSGNRTQKHQTFFISSPRPHLSVWLRERASKVLNLYGFIRFVAQSTPATLFATPPTVHISGSLAFASQSFWLPTRENGLNWHLVGESNPLQPSEVIKNFESPKHSFVEKVRLPLSLTRQLKVNNAHPLWGPPASFLCTSAVDNGLLSVDQFSTSREVEVLRPVTYPTHSSSTLATLDYPRCG